MVFRFHRDGDADRLDRIEAMLQGMFVDDARAVDLAMGALLGTSVARDIGPELRATDHRVNEAEREIRRDLVIHASVHGGIDTPAILIYMSIVKDVERVGDYAKNVYDLAADGVTFTDGHHAEEFRQWRADLAALIPDVAVAFEQRDEALARPLLARGDRMLDRFDERVSALVRGEDQSSQAVAVALTYRYIKRIVAHLMNVLSAVVMPLDHLDYFDEDPEDRR